MDNARITIKDILSWIDIDSVDETVIDDISLDSSFVGKNWLYIAYKGSGYDGKDYIEQAKRNGAVRVISDDDIKDIKSKIELLAYKFYKEPEIDFIGVTGTSGKSTTAYLVSSIYNLLGRKTLLITTTKGIKNSFVVDKTTPDILTLLKIARYAKDNGYKQIVMECSSIGIATRRIDKIHFKSILLNLITSDHLDFHKTKTNYKMTKINYLKTNADKIYLLKSNKDKKYFNKDKRLVIINDKVINPFFSLSISEFTYLNVRFKSKLLLPFNTKNVLLALGYFLDRGFNINLLRSILLKIPPLKGRMEMIEENIFIDYAHTTNALKCLLKEVKRICPLPLIVVLGAGGQRDTNKRKEYRKVLKRYADIVVITNDNPRKEDPLKILKDLKGREMFLTIPNRKAAIEFALNLYFETKTVLVVGKGDEDYQEIEGVKYPFKDKEVIRKCLKN